MLYFLVAGTIVQKDELSVRPADHAREAATRPTAAAAAGGHRRDDRSRSTALPSTARISVAAAAAAIADPLAETQQLNVLAPADMAATPFLEILAMLGRRRRPGAAGDGRGGGARREVEYRPLDGVGHRLVRRSTWRSVSHSRPCWRSRRSSAPVTTRISISTLEVRPAQETEMSIADAGGGGGDCAALRSRARSRGCRGRGSDCRGCGGGDRDRGPGAAGYGGARCPGVGGSCHRYERGCCRRR